MRENSIIFSVTFLLNHARTLRAPQSAPIFVSGWGRNKPSEGSWTGMVETDGEYLGVEVFRKSRESCSRATHTILGTQLPEPSRWV